MFAQKKKLWTIVAAVVAIGIIGGGASAGMVVATGGSGNDQPSTGVVVATDGSDDDQPITGSALGECTAAALAENPGGTVTETEVGDEGAAYGVEIRLGDGSQVEVNLDDNCQVIGQEADDDGPNDEDGPDDDSDGDSSDDDGSNDKDGPDDDSSGDGDGSSDG